MKNVREQTSLDSIDFHCIDKTKTFFKYILLSHTGLERQEHNKIDDNKIFIFGWSIP